MNQLNLTGRLQACIRHTSLVVLLASAASVHADPSLMIRDNDEDGNYRIDSDADCFDGCKLRESADYGNTWTVIAAIQNAPDMPDVEITDKPDGTYRYELEEVEFD